MRRLGKGMLALGLGVALGLPGASRAAGTEQLRDFLATTSAARGAFEQIAPGPRKTTVHSSGHFEFQRPGRFRWSTETPYEQLIVGDGEWLIVWDPDLRQVTRRRLAGALPASPASILFGSNQFEKDFQVSDEGRAEGIDWILAVPRARDAPFDRIRIGFRDSLPAAMELRDGFGQMTQLTFSAIERNPALPAARFRFTAPAGADVLESQ